MKPVIHFLDESLSYVRRSTGRLADFTSCGRRITDYGNIHWRETLPSRVTCKQCRKRLYLPVVIKRKNS